MRACHWLCSWRRVFPASTDRPRAGLCATDPQARRRAPACGLHATLLAPLPEQGLVVCTWGVCRLFGTGSKLMQNTVKRFHVSSWGEAAAAVKNTHSLGFVYEERERAAVGNVHITVPMVFCTLFIRYRQVASTNTLVMAHLRNCRASFWSCSKPKRERVV